MPLMGLRKTGVIDHQRVGGNGIGPVGILREEAEAKSGGGGKPPQLVIGAGGVQR